MKFHDYINVITEFNDAPERGDHPKLTRDELKELVRDIISGELTTAMYDADSNATKSRINMCNVVNNSLLIEDFWVESGRPFYDVYPSVSEFIGKLNLDFSPNELSMPHGVKALLLKFHGSHQPKYILFSIQKSDNLTVFSYVVSRGEVGIDLMQFSIGVPDNTTIEDSLKLTFDSVIDKFVDAASVDRAYRRWEYIVKILKIVSSVCLINNDPDLVEPQVLTDDINKVNAENVFRLIDKARKRGKFGFSFGKSLEQIPHLRRPHMYWQAYGPKHAFRRFRKRKGSVIHKDKIVTVPTGFEDESVYS